MFGEWRKCHEHREEQARKTDGHRINPNQRRWENQLEGEGVALDVQGRSFLRMRSHSDTLPYRQGFARWPEDVRNAAVLADYKRHLINRWSLLKSLGIRGLFDSIDHSARLTLTSPDGPVVIRATRLTLMMVTLGLALVGVSILVHSPTGVIFEYCATFSFIIALAASRSGVGRADQRWLRKSLTDAAKGIAGLTGLAVLTGLVELYGHEVVDVLTAIFRVIFSAIIFVVVVSLLYHFSTREKTKASKKKGTRRKRGRSRK
ncbi:MAG: hypothetical protein ACRDRW_08465 [Pseudonocardiaceae bacterium]